MAVGRKNFLNLICIKVHLKYSLTVNIQLSHHTFVKNHTHGCELSPSLDKETVFSVLFYRALHFNFSRPVCCLSEQHRCIYAPLPPPIFMDVCTFRRFFSSPDACEQTV